ncbi:CRAL/TRIO domain-containing protein, partial [Operophtera brumata]
MESLPDNIYLKFHPDTLTYIRRQYNLDKPGEMDRAIDVLEEWLKKQNHFTVKSFPRNFLERQIILDKGSVERVKNQLENLFTMKSIVTSFIGKYDARNDFGEIYDV